MPTVRRKIKWPTKKRNGGTRKWKTKWVTMHVKEGGVPGAPAPKAEKPTKPG